MNIINTKLQCYDNTFILSELTLLNSIHSFEVVILQQTDSIVYKLKPRSITSYSLYKLLYLVQNSNITLWTFSFKCKLYLIVLLDSLVCYYFYCSFIYFLFISIIIMLFWHNSLTHSRSNSVSSLRTLFNIAFCFDKHLAGAFSSNFPWYSRQIH